MWQAALGLIGVVVVAILARVPAWSAAGRRTVRLKSEAETLDALPEGDARTRFEASLNKRIELHLLSHEIEEVLRSRTRARYRSLAASLVLLVSMVFFIWSMVTSLGKGDGATDAFQLGFFAAFNEGVWLGFGALYITMLAGVVVLGQMRRSQKMDDLAREMYDRGDRYPLSDAHREEVREGTWLQSPQPKPND